jgi:hypothetical protein
MTDWDSKAAAEDLVESLRRKGWDLSLPRYVSHDVCVRAQEDAESLASELQEAGCVIESVDEDPDYNRWVLRIREGSMMLVTADAIIATQARIEPIILARGGWLNGVGVGTTEEEQ